MRLAGSRLALLLALLLGGPGLGCAPPTDPTPTDPAPSQAPIDGWLDPRNPPAGPLAVGEERLYALHLEPGQLLRLRAEQEGVDLTLALETPDGRELVFSDGPNGGQGPEWLVAEALPPSEGPPSDETSEYRLRIEGIDGAGDFRLTVEHLGPPRSGDRALGQALELLAAGPYVEDSDPARPAALLEPPGGETLEPPLPGLVRARLHGLRGWWLDDLGRLEETRQALEAAARGFENHGQAMERAPLLNTLGQLLRRLDRDAEAERTLRLALDLAEESGNLRAQSVGWNNLAVLLTARADHSAALRAYGRALDAHQRLDPQGPPTETALVLRQNLGIEQIQLGRLDEGIAELEWVLEARRQDELERQRDPEGEGRTLLSLAWARGLKAPEASPEPALDAFARAIERLEQAEATEPLAVAFELRGQLLRRLGRHDAARLDFQRAIETAETEVADGVHGALVHLGLGALLREVGDIETSIAVLERALATLEDAGRRAGEVEAARELGRSLAAAGRRPEAARAFERAIRAVERSREALYLPDFRRTYLAGQQSVYDELVDLWASAALEADPGRAVTFAERAFEAAERAKARALLDQLLAPGHGAPRSTDPSVEQRRVLDALEARRVLPGQGSRGERGVPEITGPNEPAATRRARFAWQRARESAERDRGQRLPSAEPVGASELRALLAESDGASEAGAEPTRLLAYHLGTESSWLFRIESEGVRVFELPPRSELEARARRAHELLPLSTTRGYRLAAEAALPALAEAILRPIVDELAQGPPCRLLVVPAGPLHLVPFGLLPLPGGDGERLLDRHTVVHLPSASTWVHLQRRAASREPASRALALVADPVFARQDPRFGEAESSPPQSSPLESSPAASEPTLRTPRTPHRDDGPTLHRLPSTLDEARRIAELVGKRMQRMGDTAEPPPIFHGFAAHRGTVLGDANGPSALLDHRILHFATHGLVDAADPALAGLVLSLYDAEGRPRNGFLPARDLHDVRFDADLVVLSACRTALGEEIRGAGLVGLGQGFFAAGAQALVVSLWDVDDRATAELMVRFYGHLFAGDGGDPAIGSDPAEALRRAQLELRDEGTPAGHWGAFVVLGSP